MALIRHDIHQDVRNVVEGAEAAANWHRYVQGYPWAAVGAAFAIGFILVPRRHRQAAAPAIHVHPGEVARAVAAEIPRALPIAAPEPEKKKGKGLVRMALGLAMPVVLRAAQGYALQFFEQWMAQKMSQQHLGGLEGLAASVLGGAGQPQPQGPPPRQAPPQGSSGRPPGGPRF